MKVFLSWSGERSRRVSELLDGWIQCVLQAVDPWVSSRDIDRGSLWFSEITNQLRDTSVGIICLTSENKDKPWILFEAGALAKGLSSNRVCTLLIDLESTDITDPLAQFNHTSPTRDGMWGLVRTLNAALGEKQLKEKILIDVFETYWPQFKSSFNKIMDLTKEQTIIAPEREEQDIMLELLSLVRGLDRRIRDLEVSSFKPIISTHNKLEDSMVEEIVSSELDKKKDVIRARLKAIQEGTYEPVMKSVIE